MLLAGRGGDDGRYAGDGRLGGMSAKDTRIGLVDTDRAPARRLSNLADILTTRSRISMAAPSESAPAVFKLATGKVPRIKI